MSAGVRIYTTRMCTFCIMARELLQQKKVDFEEIPLDGDADGRRRLAEETGRHTVPQIFVGDVHIGGYDELAALEQGGRLDQLLAELNLPGRVD